MKEYAVFVEGLDDLNLNDLAPKVERFAYQAINKTADFARARNASDMRRLYNFPGNYLDPSQGRLVISKRAKTNNLESIITGRARATSLARFLVEDNGVNRRGVVIEMLKGQRTGLESAFPVRLNGGQSMGLAVRTKDGAKPAGAYKPSRLGKGVWLLYGISVNQAFNYTRDMSKADAELYLEAEFNRLMDMENL